jgi:hypothetical protein
VLPRAFPRARHAATAHNRNTHAVAQILAAPERVTLRTLEACLKPLAKARAARRRALPARTQPQRQRQPAWS